MTAIVPPPLTYADASALRTLAERAVADLYGAVAALRHELPSGPALSHVEAITESGMAIRIPLKRSGKQPPFVEGPRYEPAAINGELAMILYRAAIRLGLHATGVEAALLARIEVLEGMLAKAGVEIVRGQAAAEALAAAERSSAGHQRTECGCADCRAARERGVR